MKIGIHVQNATEEWGRFFVPGNMVVLTTYSGNLVGYIMSG